jgi:thioesterase domain-containing protein
MSSEAVLQEAEDYLHREIPITRAMGVRVTTSDEKQFVVEAPVASNSNHLRTGFGGSINAVATLAGYGLVWSALKGQGAYVVVAKSSIQFLRPIQQTIRAVCLRPGFETWSAFQNRLVSKGQASISLAVSVIEQGEVAAEFKGIFVARLG